MSLANRLASELAEHKAREARRWVVCPQCGIQCEICYGRGQRGWRLYHPMDPNGGRCPLKWERFEGADVEAVRARQEAFAASYKPLGGEGAGSGEARNLEEMVEDVERMQQGHAALQKKGKR